MFIEKFTKWNTDKSDQDKFNLFAEEYMHAKSTRDSMKDIMYQVYMNQCCIEGLIEDAEFGSLKKEASNNISSIENIGDKV